jgi:adenylylsulfate kinase
MSQNKVIFIQGLPGSGKTTLAKVLQQKLNAIHVNADWARSTITSHLGFSNLDRVKQATTLGQLARMLHFQGHWVIVDFVCPLATTRNAFQEQFLDHTDDVFKVWMNTIDKGRFEDTNKMYVPPKYDEVDYQIGNYLESAEEFDKEARQIAKVVTTGHKKYYIRYNTHSDGHTNQWRVINAATMEEYLFDDFELRGLMVPATTVEHGVTKYNVEATGYPSIENTPDGFRKFVLTY